MTHGSIHISSTRHPRSLRRLSHRMPLLLHMSRPLFHRRTTARCTCRVDIRARVMPLLAEREDPLVWLAAIGIAGVEADRSREHLVQLLLHCRLYCRWGQCHVWRRGDFWRDGR